MNLKFGKVQIDTDDPSSSVTFVKDDLDSELACVGAPAKISFDIDEDMIKDILSSYFNVEPDDIDFFIASGTTERVEAKKDGVTVMTTEYMSSPSTINARIYAEGDEITVKWSKK